MGASESLAVREVVLPQKRAHRPLTRGQWYRTTFPLALVLGATVGLLTMLVSPLVLCLSFGGIVGWSAFRRRRLSRLLRLNDDGIAMLATGEIDAAAEVFDRLSSDARSMPALHSLFVYNRAVAHLELGEHEDARALLLAVLRAGWVSSDGSMALYYANVLGRMAMVEALLGNLPEAEKWRTSAHQATSDAKQGSLLLVDVLVEARRGARDEVLELIQTQLRKAENMLPLHQLRAIRLLQAFVLRSDPQGYRIASVDEEAQHALAFARDAEPGTFDYLAVCWPELRLFIDAWHLGGSDEDNESFDDIFSSTETPP